MQPNPAVRWKMGNDFVPNEFQVPKGLETPHFKLRPLTIHDAVKDYEAVMSSAARIKGVLGPDVNWPREDLTLEQDLIDLGWHHKEFQIRSSFAYTVMSLDENRCLGCIYFYASEVANYDAMVVMWVRDSEMDKGLDSELFSAVKKWVENDWPFRAVAYPGRETDWSECNSFR